MFWWCPFVLTFFLWSQSAGWVHLSIAAAPRVTASTAQTGLVLLEGQIDAAGSIAELRVNQGPAPFVEQSLEVVRQWEFNSRGDDAPPLPISVVLLFRARTDLPDSPFTFSVPVNDAKTDRSPQPVKIVDPGYPVDSTAEGTVILQMEIGTDGRVQKAEVIQEVPSLTQAVVDAVSQWEFTPAKDRGTPTNGLAVAVISFRRPTMTH